MGSNYFFCPHCANLLEPFSDGERLRRRCTECGWIHYQNPTAGVAVVLLENDQLLLGERLDGGWCIPCGHVEWDETIELAAKREFSEETGLKVNLEGVIAVYSNFHDRDHQTVGIWYTGSRTGGILRPGGDLLQVAFFSLDDLPKLKFPTDRRVVEQIINEHKPNKHSNE